MTRVWLLKVNNVIACHLTLYIYCKLCHVTYYLAFQKDQELYLGSLVNSGQDTTGIEHAFTGSMSDALRYLACMQPQASIEVRIRPSVCLSICTCTCTCAPVYICLYVYMYMYMYTCPSVICLSICTCT